MDIEIKVWLYDIMNAIKEINSFFDEGTMQFSKYQKSKGKSAKPKQAKLKSMPGRQATQ